MADATNLGEIETRCGGILNSPYLFRELPPELRNLKALLVSVQTLTRDDVPHLIAEVKRLRSEVKRLEAAASLAAAESLAASEATAVGAAEEST